jgi:hypothetical protein
MSRRPAGSRARHPRRAMFQAHDEVHDGPYNETATELKRP